MMPSRFAGLGFTASLLLNAFLIGFLVAHEPRHEMMRYGPPGPGPGPGPEHLIYELADRLPKADGDFLRAEIGARESRLHEADAVLRAFPRHVHDVLSASNFDPAALDGVLNQAAQAISQMFVLDAEAASAAIRKMSPEGRRILADPPGPPPPPQ